MRNCIFCKIINGEVPTTILYQDDSFIVFPDINPKAEVHLLMVPKLHIKSLAELDDHHSKLIAHMMINLSKIATSQGLSHGFRTIINTGPGGGQEIDHLHIHILGGKNLPGF
jgi:histidine triad (HIT) family protein